MNIKQIALITGGASGLGAATAKYLKEQGATVIIIDQSVQHSHELAYKCNVTDEIQLKNMLKKIFKEVGIPRICVNCAGIATAQRIVNKQGAMPLADFQKVININLIGPFNVMRLVAEKMCQLAPLDSDNQRGVIINTASTAAFDGQLGQAAYSASKGAIVSLTLPAARELAQFGIRVMTIAPGVMDTPMMAQMPDKVRGPLAHQVPFPSRFGQTQEFALLVKHIVENNYLNGSVIRLDGGLRMA